MWYVKPPINTAHYLLQHMHAIIAISRTDPLFEGLQQDIKFYIDTIHQSTNHILSEKTYPPIIIGTYYG